MSNRFPLRIAAAALLLSACASQPGPIATLDATAPCCASLAQLPYRTLVLGQESAFELTTASPMYQFESGKAYFQAFRLPADATAFDLTLSSRLPTRSPSAWDAFCPALTFLDEDHQPIETWPTQAQFAPHLQRWVVELAAPERARFVVVHVGAAELSGSRAMRYPISGISLPATYQSGTKVEGGLITSEALCGLRGRHGIRATATAARTAR